MKRTIICALAFGCALISPANADTAPQTDPRDKIYQSTGLDGEDTSEPWWSVMASCFGSAITVTSVMELGNIEKVDDQHTVKQFDEMGEKWRDLAAERLIKDRQITKEAAMELIANKGFETAQQLGEVAGENYDQITADILAIATKTECEAAELAYKIEFAN